MFLCQMESDYFLCWFICVMSLFDLVNSYQFICLLTYSLQGGMEVNFFTYCRLGVRCKPNIWRVWTSNEGVSHVQEEETRAKQGASGCKSNEKTGRDFFKGKEIMKVSFHKLEIALLARSPQFT